MFRPAMGPVAFSVPVVASSLPMMPVSLPSSEGRGVVGTEVSGSVAGRVAGVVGVLVAGTLGVVARVGSVVTFMSCGVQPQAVSAETVRTSVRSITHNFFIFIPPYKMSTVVFSPIFSFLDW